MKSKLNSSQPTFFTFGAVLVAAAYLATPRTSEAALVVTSDLGSFGVGSTVNITGDTATGANNADIYSSTGVSPDLNWGNELVYQFTLTEAAEINLSVNSRTGDPDFFLLNGLSTGTHANGKTDALGGLAYQFLDGGPPDSGVIRTVGAGTYYLSVDAFDNGAGDDSVFDIDMSFEAITAAPSGAFDLGIIGDEFDQVMLDTFGSDFDTELGLYDSLGNLVAVNDDTASGSQSKIGPESLSDGEYFVALGAFDTVFENSFGVTPGHMDGNYILNYQAGIKGTERGVVDSSIAWYRFQLSPGSRVPDTGATALLCLLAFGGVRLLKRLAR